MKRIFVAEMVFEAQIFVMVAGFTATIPTASCPNLALQGATVVVKRLPCLPCTPTFQVRIPLKVLSYWMKCLWMSYKKEGPGVAHLEEITSFILFEKDLKSRLWEWKLAFILEMKNEYKKVSERLSPNLHFCQKECFDLSKCHSVWRWGNKN